MQQLFALNMFALISMHVCLISYGCRLHFVAAFGETDGELMSRSAASHGKTVRFSMIGQFVRWNFLTQSSCNIDILNVIHSNDGPSDNLTLYLNRKEIGSFQSVEHTREGVFWNEMVESGLVGKTNVLSKGNHTLYMNVSAVDIYGIEIDNVIVGALCGNDGGCLVTILGEPHVTNAHTNFPSEDNHPWSQGNIITLAVGVTSTLVSVLIAVPSVVVAIWSIYKCVNGEWPRPLTRRLKILKEPLVD